MAKSTPRRQRPAPTQQSRSAGSGSGGALARRDQQQLAKVPEQPLTDIKALNEQIHALQASCNVVMPIVRIDSIPAMHQVSLRQALIDPTVPMNGQYPKAGAGPEVYFDPKFCKDNERALGKRAVMKILRAAGISIADTRRIDDGSEPYYWHWTVTIQGRDFDGEFASFTKSREVDLRDGAPETLKAEWACKQHGTDGCDCPRKQFRKTGRQIPLDPSALAAKRVHGASNAETKALLRAARAMLNLPQKMTVDQLQKPFVIPKLVAHLDTSDPEVKAALIQKTVFGNQVLFGVGAQPTPARKTLSPGQARRTGVAKALAASQGVDLDDDQAAQVAEAAGGDTPTTIDQPLIDVEPQDAPGEDGPLGPEPPPPGQAPEGGAGAQQARSLPPDQAAAPRQAEEPPSADDEPMPAGLEEDEDPNRCTCPCGCAKSTTPQLAAKGRDQLGTVRCKSCYPDLGFEQEAHAALPNLEIPKYPNATPAVVARWNERRRAKQGDRS